MVVAILFPIYLASGVEMRNIIIFILGCITSYFLLYQGTNEVFKLWKVAYDVGREDATAVAKHSMNGLRKD